MARTEKFTRDHHDKDSMMLELCICRKKTHQQELGMIIYIYLGKWVVLRLPNGEGSFSSISSLVGPK